MSKKRDELLSHEADGIREFDNALPRWWLYIFYFTIGFAVVYLVNYHVLPTPLVGRAGLEAEYRADVARAASLMPVSTGGPAVVRPLTDQGSLEKGRAIFEGDTNVCASCHRPDLGGLIGPNLTDDYWLHGCSPAEIATSIRTGYPTKGMMPFGTGQRLSDEQVLQVASYIISKHDSHPEAPKATDPAREQRCGGNDAMPAIADEDHDSFRDALASVRTDGRRRWIYARKPSGAFYRARTAVSLVLLAILFTAPFVRIGGQPLVLLNIIERRFVFFGVVFWPQDFYLVVILALTGLVTMMIATVTIGRVWCGWLCPQTIFMEMLFRKIEYAIDGSAEQQLRRDRALAEPGAHAGVPTIARRFFKQAVFFALSFAIANLFLSYIIGTGALAAIVMDPPRRHLAGLTAITIFSLLFYGVFARFREQACTLACPYGRVMSALQDARTIMVTYDWRRGEPRGRIVAGAQQERGDCVDCGQCVTVCPTGIDIRNGIQLECVNCTACIDACSGVMRRVNRPTGLIRLTSHDAVRTGRVTWLTARVRAYAAVWLVLVGLCVTLLVRWPDVDVLILRQPGTLAAAVSDDSVANFYNVQVINRTRRPQQLEYRVTSPADARVTPLGPIELAQPQQLVDSRLLLTLPTSGLDGAATPVVFEVRMNGRVIQTIHSSFIDPRGHSSHHEGERQ